MTAGIILGDDDSDDGVSDVDDDDDDDDIFQDASSAKAPSPTDFEDAIGALPLWSRRCIMLVSMLGSFCLFLLLVLCCNCQLAVKIIPIQCRGQQSIEIARVTGDSRRL